MMCPSLNNVQVGTVGEQLVRYKLMRWGFEAIMMEQGNDYDIMVMVDGKPFRLQVKSTLAVDNERPDTYRFATSKGNKSKKRYSCKSIDGMALVALDIERIYFTPPIKTVCKRLSLGYFNPNRELTNWMDIISDV